jgi:hypothetical protein
MLTIETTIKLTKDINRVSVNGDLNIENPVRGFIVSRNIIPPNIAVIIKIPRKILRVIDGNLEETTIRYFAFSFAFKFDLKLILEISSWSTPIGQAKPQKIRPTINEEANKKLKIINTGRRALNRPFPLRMIRKYWMGTTA